MPAVYTWTGQFSSDATDPDNWRNSDYPAQLSPDIPSAGSDVVFAGGDMGVDTDCDNFESFGGKYNVVHVDDTYTSTITLAGPLETMALWVENGTINQPRVEGGTDITVEGAFPVYSDEDNPWDDPAASFWWTGGTINHFAQSEYSAKLRVIGAEATGIIDFGDAVEWETGDTLYLEGGATVDHVSGAIEFTAGDGVDIDDDCTFAAPPNTSGPPELVNATNEVMYVNIRPGGSYLAKKSWDSQLLIYNNGGTVYVAAGQTLKVIDIFGGLVPIPSVTQVGSGAKTRLDGGSHLEVPKGMVMSAGSLWVAPNEVALGWRVAKIHGNLSVSGGFIEFDLSGYTTATGTLYVDGDVNWSGGQYNPGYDFTRNQAASCWWATGTMTITGGIVHPVEINGPATPSAGWIYPVLKADNGFVGVPTDDSDLVKLVSWGPGLEYRLVPE